MTAACVRALHEAGAAMVRVTNMRQGFHAHPGVPYQDRR